jgi:hypothetical protein
MGARQTGVRGRGAGAKRGPKAKPLVVPQLAPELVDPALQQITKRIPAECLAKFEEETPRILYASILLKFVEETIPEGSTILQVLVAERAAYYWTMAHTYEQGNIKGNKVTEDYKFYIYEFNRNLETLRGLAIRNLPATQVRLLAKKTINVIERIIKNPTEKDAIIKEIVHEFTIEVSNIGFKKQSVSIEAPAASEAP